MMTMISFRKHGKSYKPIDKYNMIILLINQKRKENKMSDTITRNPSVKVFEDNRKAVAKNLLLSKSEYTLGDIPAKGYPFVYESFFGDVYSWEDAFMKSPKKASNQFRSMLQMSFNAGESSSVESILQAKVSKANKKPDAKAAKAIIKQERQVAKATRKAEAPARKTARDAEKPALKASKELSKQEFKAAKAARKAEAPALKAERKAAKPALKAADAISKQNYKATKAAKKAEYKAEKAAKKEATKK